MPSKVCLATPGLYTSPNPLSAPDGNLDIASNIIIKRGDIIEPRRGFGLWAEPFGSISQTAKQIFSYKQRLLRYYSNILQFQNGENNDGSVNFDDFNGTYNEVQAGLRPKAIESNGNFYFTSSAGVKKISAATASQLSTNSGYIINAGGVKALDVSAKLKITDGSLSGFLPSDNAIAYRIVWGIKDANANLILGAPSQRAEIANTLLNLDIRDFNNLLSALDNINQAGSMVTDGNYVSTLALPNSASASELKNNLVTLASKIDNDILYANDTGAGAPLNINTVTISNGVVTVNFSSGTATNYFSIGSKIKISNFLSNSTDIPALNKEQIITFVDASNIKFTSSDYVNGINGAGLGGAITSIAIGSPGIVTSLNHGLVSGQRINIAGTSTTPATTGNQVVTVLSENTFSIPVNVTVVTGGSGTWNLVVDGVASSTIVSNEYRSIVGEVISPQTEPFDTFTVSIPATNNDVKAIQNCIDQILTRLNLEPNAVISDTLTNTYLAGLDITQSANVTLTITVPDGVTSSHFFQVYRSNNFPADGVTSISDVFPNDELKLAYEAYPTTAELAAKQVIVEDITPEGFLGANLYTNPSTGSGILQANDIPPFCKDINRFKNVVFYANTKTRHRKLLSLLGVSNLIDEYNGGNTPRLTISDGTNTISVTFVTGLQEITDITFPAESAFTGGTRRYFDIWSANDETAYRVVFESPTMTADPTLTGKTPIRVLLAGGETASQVASKCQDKLNTFQYDFSAAPNTLPKIRITNVNFGASTNVATGTMPGGTTITNIQDGRSEDATAKQVLLSTSVSPSIAVDETARSLIRVINKNNSSPVYGYYISGAQDVPGKMFFESKLLNTEPFSILTNASLIGESFSPDISPDLIITNITNSNPATITTSTAHGILNGEKVSISSNVADAVNGVFVATVTGTNTFTILANGSPGGVTGGVDRFGDAEISENEEKKNRVYYSKFQEPESVPINNYLQVGAEDKAILRIFPLRDSLFVFKEDGLFRISGESAPFVVQLFDSSCIINAADTIGLANNLLYLSTTQGISSVSESGVNIISRNIDNLILKVITHTNYATAAHATGYESDNSYIIWVPKNINDTTGSIAFRYSNLTNSWTTYDKDNTCSFINPVDNKLYLGASDTNYIEQERKNFDRTDYADRAISTTLELGRYSGNTIVLPSVIGMAIGDVLVQEQLVSIPEFNGVLKKLDIDPGVNDSNYFATVGAVAGDDLRTKMQSLTAKLDTDTGINDTDYSSSIATKTGSITSASVANPTIITTSAPHGILDGRIVSISGVTGSIPAIGGTYQVTVTGPSTFSIPVSVTTPGTGGSFTTLNGDFRDIKACMDGIINKLNTDIGVSYSNFLPISQSVTTEAIITAVNFNLRTITLNNALEYIQGPMTVYKAFKSELLYDRESVGDPLNYKQFREATLIFEAKNFTGATVSFSTDLLPEYIDVPFNGDGNGIFGYSGIFPLASVGFGGGFFGGGSNGAPFRTYIPRQCQRCRYISLKFSHQTARETYALLGYSLTFNVGSERAYR
jgi:hypothetical protein